MNFPTPIIENTPVAGSDKGWLQKASDVQLTGWEHAYRYTEERWKASQEAVIDNDKVELVAPRPATRDDLNRLTIYQGGQEYGLTRWSFGQLASLAKGPAQYLRTLPSQLVRDAIEYGLRVHRRDENVKVFSDPINGVKAFTSESYGRVPDHEVIEAAQSVIDQHGWEPADAHMGFRATDRGISLFIIDRQNPISYTRRNGHEDTVYRGLHLRHSEVGASSLVLSGFLLHGYCNNGLIFKLGGDEFKVQIRHTKNAPFRWAREIQPAIEHYAAEGGTKLIEALDAAKADQVARDDDEMVDWLNRRGESRSRARDIVNLVKAEEGHAPRTRWDAIQGLTALARSAHSVDSRVELEETAGKWLAQVAQVA